MDVRQELCKIDPSVRPHFSTKYRHHTWAHTFHSRPEYYIQPQTTEELQQVIKLARRCRRRIAVVGCGHSPSDLTCTSSWLVNLDHLEKILDVDKESNMVVMQAGIRLHNLGLKLKEHGLALPNIGSIDHQSIAGAIGTATHGSSIRHGLLSQSVLALKIMLANGRTVSCSAEQNTDLFRAALVSLGALGIITEVTYQAVPSFNVQWAQSLHPLEEVIADWDKGLWTQNEFTRVWWLPYTKRCIKWRANKTKKSEYSPKSNWWNGSVGFHAYHVLLYCAQFVPGILPWLESFVINVQYGFKDGAGNVAVQEGRTGLLMNCLYSQFVNEWAIPLQSGPEAITRLSAWLHGDQQVANIPFSSKNVYVHAPIEVRVSDTSSTRPRPFLDNTPPTAPALYLNATLYRPYNCDPPCHDRYYEAFEWLMKEMGGRPHWAKNFSTVSRAEMHAMYPDIEVWIRIRHEVDPDGMFVGDWHRRLLLPENEEKSNLPNEERMLKVCPASAGGLDWVGYIPGRTSSPQGSEESFDIMHGVETEKSVLFDRTTSEEEEEL